MLNEDLLQEFLYECTIRKLSTRTLKGYKNNNKKMFGFIKEEYGVTEVEQTKAVHIKGYMRDLTDLGLSASYINGIIICAQVMYDYAVNESYIKENPVRKIKKQKEPIRLIHTFTDNEVRAMLKANAGHKFLQLRNQLIIIMLFDTGMRNSEMCNLKMIDIHETAIHIIGKGDKERYVPVTPSIYKAFLRYQRVREMYCKGKPTYEIDYVFLSQKGRKLTVEALEHILKQTGEAAHVRKEIRCSPHTCRHYYAQAQLKNGCDLYTLSKLLGHSKIDTTKRYLASMKDDDVIAMGIATSPLSNL